MPNPPDTTPDTNQQPLADRSSDGAAYVKPILKPLGDWHLVVRTATSSEADENDGNNFFDFGF